MSTHEQEFLEVYCAARVDDQVAYYKRKCEQFERAHNQVLAISALVLGLSSTVALLAGVATGGQEIFAILAALLPALSTALAAYATLFAFDRHTKLYSDAIRSLRRLELPDLKQLEGRDSPALIAEYIEKVEEVFRSEQGQWGQLASQPLPGEGESPDSGPTDRR